MNALTGHAITYLTVGIIVMPIIIVVVYKWVLS